jgi:signal transduction histidine kinase
MKSEVPERDQALGAEREAMAGNALQLRQANECLVVAALNAQTLASASASDQTSTLLRDANERLVLATLHAQNMAAVADQATAQVAYRAELEGRLLEAQKQEALGILAGGVAHDFNNLLTAIIGNAEIGALSAPADSKVAQCLEAIMKAALKAAELTRQLLAYTGKGQLKLTQLDLGLVVREITELLAVSVPEQVNLQCELGERLPWVTGDPTQIFQVLMNLIGNAIQAVPTGRTGHINVHTRAERVATATAASPAWILPLEPGPYATVEVADDGVGMAPEVLARIFEPFFSTKATGHGLGLAAVVGILRSHGAGLRVESEAGRGSSFKLFLPAHQEPRPGSEPRPPRRAREERRRRQSDGAAASL